MIVASTLYLLAPLIDMYQIPSMFGDFIHVALCTLVVCVGWNLPRGSTWVVDGWMDEHSVVQHLSSHSQESSVVRR